MEVLLMMKPSSKFTFDYKYIINGFQIHNESERATGSRFIRLFQFINVELDIVLIF